MKRSEYQAFIFAHIALFTVFVWFGALKILGLSPANELVEALLKHTMPFMTFHTFSFCLGIYEVLVGILFILPRCEKFAFILLVPHIIMTTLPLVLLPTMTWQSSFVPTMEGQYIIKNILIVALAASIYVDMKKKRA